MKYVIGHFVSGNLIVVTKRCFTILVKCYNVTKKIIYVHRCDINKSYIFAFGNTIIQI